MTVKCLCSHPLGRHERGTAQCWSLACGCQSYRPDVGECSYCLGSGVDVDPTGMEVSTCRRCDGAGRAA